MSILVRRCLRRADLVQTLVEDWRLQHDDVHFALDVEDLVQECLDLSKSLQDGWTTLLNRLFNEQIDDIGTVGEMMGTAIDRSLQVFDEVTRLLAECKRRKYDVECTAELNDAKSRIGKLKAEVASRWPSVDFEMGREALEAFHRGEYRSTEDILHELEDQAAKADSFTMISPDAAEYRQRAVIG